MTEYENIYYCTRCKKMQYESSITYAISIPCPHCGNNYFTSEEPSGNND